MKNKLKQSVVWALTALFSRTVSEVTEGNICSIVLYPHQQPVLGAYWCLWMFQTPASSSSTLTGFVIWHGPLCLPSHSCSVSVMLVILHRFNMMTNLNISFFFISDQNSKHLISRTTEIQCARLIGDTIPPYLLHNWSWNVWNRLDPLISVTFKKICLFPVKNMTPRSWSAPVAPLRADDTRQGLFLFVFLFNEDCRFCSWVVICPYVGHHPAPQGNVYWNWVQTLQSFTSLKELKIVPVCDWSLSAPAVDCNLWCSFFNRLCVCVCVDCLSPCSKL